MSTANVIGKAIESTCRFVTSTCNSFLTVDWPISRQNYRILPAEQTMLKASFYIPVLVDENRPLKLLIEAGSQTVSFLWYHCDPQSLAGLAVYNLGQPLTAGIWQKLVGAEPELSRLADQVIVLLRYPRIDPRAIFLFSGRCRAGYLAHAVRA